MYPVVSVIIPAKNEEHNIERCINGIRSLNYPSKFIEIILVDNGSSDNTVGLAKNFSVNTYVVKGVTIGALRNYGVYKSSGEYIAFIDADCIPDPDWLNVAISCFKSNHNILVVSGIMILEDEPCANWVEKLWVNYLSSKMRQKNSYISTIASYCFVVKKEDFLKIGGFNESLTTCEDSDFGFRLGRYGRILKTSDIKTIHLGNAKSLLQFFKRQLWQGRSNLENIFKHNFVFAELPSLLVPPLFVLLIISPVIVWLFCGNSKASVLLIFIACIFLLLVTIRKNCFSGIKEFLQMFIIWGVYLIARGIAFIVPRIRR